MVDFKVLKAFGTSNEQLRTYFTSKAPATPAAPSQTPTTAALGATSNTTPTSKDTVYDKSAKFRKMLCSHIEDGRRHCFRNYRHFAATDLLRDSQPNLPENIPLMAYAQGKLDIKAVETELSQINCADKFIETKKCEGNEKEVKKVVNVPRLQEVCFDVARSIISRRANAQNNKYNSLRPFFKYDTRGTRMEDHLRGEVMSQYADVMADQFGYRHEHDQAIHAMFYQRTVLFPAGAWHVDTSTQIAPDDYQGALIQDMPSGEKLRLMTRIEREGVKMVRPAAARVLYDTSKPLSGINVDLGPRWIGFWDVMRFGDIFASSDFYNKDAIWWSRAGASILDQNRAYFDLVFAGQPMNFPSIPLAQTDTANGGTVDLAAKNERGANAYLYSIDSDEDKAVFVTDLRIKVVPKTWGMGEYPHPLWLRVLVASDDQVIFAEWLPSLPAIYFGHNEDDTRLMNITMAHELMPWQDQLSNLMSQLLIKMKHALFRVILVNTDVIDDDVVKKFREDLDSPRYYTNPHLLEISFNEMAQRLGLKLDECFLIVGAGNGGGGTNANESEYINNCFKAILQILAIIEKLQNMSPQEQGQPASHEITAVEVAAMDTTTQANYNAIGQSIDKARAAWKKLLYESAMAFGSENTPHLPVSQRFTKTTIEKAGFKVLDEPDVQQKAQKTGYTVIGSKAKLVHEYVFTSRDGGDRASNREAANVLQQFLVGLLPVIGPEALGKARIFEIVNEIFRLLSSYDLKLQINEGEDDKMMAPSTEEKMAQMGQQMQQGVQQLAQQFTQQLQQLQEMLKEHEGEIGGLADAIQKIDKFIAEQGAPGAQPMPIGQG